MIISDRSVSGISHVVCAFLRREAVEQCAEAFPDGLDSALGGGAHEVFEFGEDLLDRVQVGAVGWQKQEVGTRRADGFAYGWALVAAKVVHHHHIARA